MSMEFIKARYSDSSGKAGKRAYLPRELRIHIYDEVRRLRGQGLSYRQIIEDIKKKYGVVLYKSHISFWVRRIHSPYNGRRIPSLTLLRPSMELAYIIGVVAGDGYVARSKKPRKSYHRVYIGLDVKDLEFAEAFSRSLSVVLGRNPAKPRLKPRTRKYTVEVGSETLYKLLMKPLNLRKLRPFIEHCGKCVSAFLRGFFDSEGSITKDGQIRVFNTDIRLLRYVKHLMTSMEIKTTGPHLGTRRGTPIYNARQNKTYFMKKDVYDLYIPADCRLNFYKHIGFTIRRKQQRLENYLIRRGQLKKPPAKPSPIFSHHLTSV